MINKQLKQSASTTTDKPQQVHYVIGLHMKTKNIRSIKVCIQTSRNSNYVMFMSNA